jgi:hypothetical protein
MFGKDNKIIFEWNRAVNAAQTNTINELDILTHYKKRRYAVL